MGTPGMRYSLPSTEVLLPDLPWKTVGAGHERYDGSLVTVCGL